MPTTLTLKDTDWVNSYRKINAVYPETNWGGWQEIFKDNLKMTIAIIPVFDRGMISSSLRLLTFDSEQDRLMFILKYV